ncbi:very-short-patch-repair endonuclease [Sphingomonas sp. BE270]|jgi:very-short-patch-repair endonuclease|uniref:endonuclease domain-containing protein n=1 Tax=unclassified Sphingomonas TaxID=196159 RepID=UPI00053D8CE4|nr:MULTISPECIES: endonuclease domain-containing protein [unclassified Sphingomonas]MDR6849772.1 very-short-patch-repair endonuclease [Sphingomonas sp. BE137]MDR7257273.1 very-short-patch-repair endonuclease [Sphingomonas sp. BE270]
MEQRTKARALRSTPTAAEVRLWRAISARKVAGFRFNRQVPIGPFICDFVARSLKLIIEVDGDTHGDRREQDEERTRYLQSEGYQVIRFWNNDVLGNLDGVVAEIARVVSVLGARSPSPTPSREREGSL